MVLFGEVPTFLPRWKPEVGYFSLGVKTDGLG